MSQEHHKYFDFERLYNLFNKCVKEDDTIYTDDYMDAFEELSRINIVFGPVFNFVRSDVVEKVGIMREYRKSEVAVDYETFQTMIQYEVANKIANNKKKASGSRTLLRLHRSLKFLYPLLREGLVAGGHEKMSRITKRAYEDNMAMHHPWLIRKAVHAAVFTLPTRKKISKKLGNPNADHDEVLEYIGKTADLMERIFNITEAIYTRENLHGLP